MRSVIGRFLTLVGAAVLIYSLFIPAIQLEFELPAQKLGEIVLKPRPVKVESSLRDLGEKLSDLEGSVVKIPEILDYLWLIFLALAILNALLALKPSFPRFMRGFTGLLPLALLVVVIWQTATNSDMAIGYDELLNYFIKGFYILAGGTLIILIGSLMTGYQKSPTRKHP